MKKQFYKILISALLMGAFLNGFSQNGTGLSGHYYQDSYAFSITDGSWTNCAAQEAASWCPPTSNIAWFTNLITTRIDPTIDVAKGALESYLTGVSGLNAQSPVSIRWTGYISFPTAETFTFYLSGADGLRLKINGQNVIGTFGASDPAWVVRPYLTVGGTYSALSGAFSVSQSQVNKFIGIGT